MALRLESMIGDKRVPLWYDIQGGKIHVRSLCMGVSPAAPIWIIPDPLAREEDPLEMRRLLREAGFASVTIQRGGK